MQKRKYFWILLCFLQFLALDLQAQDRRNPFMVEWDDSVQKVKPGELYTFKVQFKVPSGHYLYQDKTEVKFIKTGLLHWVKTEMPKGEKHYDPFLKEETDAYLKDFEIKVLFKVPAHAPLGRNDLEGELKYQGCSSDFCYRPMRATLLIPIEITNTVSIPLPIKSESKLAESRPESLPQVSSAPKAILPKPEKKNQSLWTLIQSGRIEGLLEENFFLVLFLAFIGGLLTCFTPCVLPIIPLTLAVVGIKKNRSAMHNLFLSLSLVLGMSATYAALGMASAFLGLKLGFLFQSPSFLIFLILFFLFMSLALWGFFQIELPLRWRNYFANMGGNGVRGAFLAGISIGFIASPCVGPLIGPILLWVAKNQQVGHGMLVLFAYGLGMGSLFIVMGTFYSTLAGKMRSGRYVNVLKKLLAISMLLPAIYYAYVVYQVYQPRVQRQAWSHSLQEGFEKAKREQKPVLIDFYADWCLPCIEIDHQTFGDPQVRAALGEVSAIQINCTTETPTCKEAVEKYDVVGWPTILFLNPKLELQNDLSVVGGFVGPEKMLEILSDLKTR